MPILEFHNRQQVPLVLVIEPGGEKYEIPHLGTAAIRYPLIAGLDDRSSSVMSEHRVEFWCAAASYEVEVVSPSILEKLSWDICLNGGWCGGIVDGLPTTFHDLLPRSGSISAEEFAALVIRADGWPHDEAMPEKHLRWLEERFNEHLGAASANVEVLREPPRVPFNETPA